MSEYFLDTEPTRGISTNLMQAVQETEYAIDKLTFGDQSGEIAEYYKAARRLRNAKLLIDDQLTALNIFVNDVQAYMDNE